MPINRILFPDRFREYQREYTSRPEVRARIKKARAAHFAIHGEEIRRKDREAKRLKRQKAREQESK